MPRSDYEVIIGLEVHAELSKKQRYSAHVQQNLEQHLTHMYAQYVWQCQEHFQY